MSSHSRVLLKICLFISIIFILLNDIFLSEIPEIFKFGDKFGQILSNLSLAYIASYVFYFLVVVLKERRDKRLVYNTVYSLIKLLIGRASSAYDFLLESSKELSDNSNYHSISKEKFNDLCRKANPQAVPLNRILEGVGRVNYGVLLYHNSVLFVKNYTERVFIYMPFLEAECIQRINKLLDSKFLTIYADMLLKTGNTDFSVYSESLFEYLTFVHDLEVYNETVIKKWIENN